MKRTFPIAALAATLIGTTAAAGPLVFEETAKISSPDPAYTSFPLEVAVEGDTIIATGMKRVETSVPYVHAEDYYAAFLFRRQSNGSWAYVRTLAQTDCDTGEQAEDTCWASVAIRNGVAVVSANQVHVFTRAPNGDWIEAPSNAFSRPGEAAVGGGAVLTSHPVCDGIGISVAQPNSSGVWTETFSSPSDIACDLWGSIGGSVDISAGNRLVASDQTETAPPAARIFEPTTTGWTQVATLTSPLNSPWFADQVAIDDSHVFASGISEAPVHVFNRVGSTWTHSGDIVPPDSAWRGPGRPKVRDLLFVGFPGDSYRRGSAGVFRANASGQYEEVAKLVSSTLQQNGSLGSHIDGYVDGSLVRVVATAPGGVHVFDLNQLGTTPAPLQEDFEQGNASSWTPMAGSVFSVVTSNGSKVYRQSSMTGDAGAFFTNINWTNQAIEADVRPTAFDGANWVGLVVRRTDASNYYYLTLSHSNVLTIKRMSNGSFVALASTPVPVALNRNYRLRLEAVGTRLRAYVDGRLAVETTDVALRQGHAGVQMYKARADFDNVVLSQDPHLTLLDHRSPSVLDDLWNFTLGSWSSTHPNGQTRFVQQGTTGDGRAITRIPANDQTVQVAATATNFAGGSGSSWFGVVARYVDSNNFYYVTVRNDNTISLRKLVNGTIQVLDTAPFTVSAGTTYTLRLEAIGSSLRAYVNGNVVLEASDSSHASGKYGLATYKTAATFDDFVAWEP